MRKVLLTSAGLTEQLKDVFLEQIGKKADSIKILFVPTASVVNDEAREAIKICFYEFQKIGILSDNIFVYDLRYISTKGYICQFAVDNCYVPAEYRALAFREVMEYDAIVFSGGNAEFLLDEIKRTGFGEQIKKAVDQGVMYLGISAGSMIAAGNLTGNLGYLKNSIYVHCEKGTACGVISEDEEIFLTDNQAVWIYGDNIRIIA